jgi:hypothetical protein
VDVHAEGGGASISLFNGLWPFFSKESSLLAQLRLSPGGQSVEFRFGHAHRFLLYQKRKEKKKIKNPISSVINGWPEQETIKGRLSDTQKRFWGFCFSFVLGVD